MAGAIIGDKCTDFDSLLLIGLWAEKKNFSYCLANVEFLVDLWKVKKLKLYGQNACPGPQSDSSGRGQGQDGKFWNGRNDKWDKLSHSMQ